jgi:hypothetical protein
MYRSVFCSLFLIVSVLLTGCSVALDVTVFNNTGGTIEVSTDHSSGTIDANQFDDFRFPTKRGAGAFELLRIVAGGCEYLYDLDRATYPNEEWNQSVVTAGRGIQVQVETDFSIDLLPAAYSGNSPAPSEVIPKREGFPLRPVAKKCG